MLFQDFFVDGPNASIAVREYDGDGQPLVLVHGGGFNLAAWGAVVDQISHQFHVVSFDLPGHGHSGLGLGVDGWSVADAVTSLGAVIEAVGLDSPMVVGHSLGGMIANHAVANGQQCCRLVNVDGWAGEPLPARLTDDQAVAATAVMAAMNALPVESIDQVVAAQTAQAGAAGLDASMMEAIIRRQFIVEGDVATMRPSADQQLAMLRSIAPLSTASDLEVTDVPVLLVLSSHPDPLPGVDVDLDAQRRGRDAIAARYHAHPTVEVTWIDAGHNIPTLAPTELAEKVCAFAP